jgi:hypothetical protein
VPATRPIRARSAARDASRLVRSTGWAHNQNNDGLPAAVVADAAALVVEAAVVVAAASGVAEAAAVIAAASSRSGYTTNVSQAR